MTIGGMPGAVEDRGWPMYARKVPCGGDIEHQVAKVGS